MSSGLTKIVEGEGLVAEYNSTSNDAFDSIKSIEFDKESFVVQLINYPNLWDKKHPKYKKRPVKSSSWEKLALSLNKDGEY